MKKIILSVFMCVISLTLVLSGCGFTPLKDSPQTTATMKQYGNTLVYDNYVYFANAFVDSSTLVAGDNNNVDNPALYRIKTTNGNPTFNEETGLPENHEKALGKILGYASSYIYSIGEYIYFTSPSTHKNDQGEATFNFNSYFRVNTNGTGLTEFYTSKNAISQQSIISIDNNYYLIIVDGNKIVKFTLGNTISKATTIAEDITTAIIPTSNNETYAYYLTAIEDEKSQNNITGSYLNKLNLVTGESEKLNSNSPANITLKLIKNGKLFFTITESDTQTYFAYLTTNFSNQHITTGIDTSSITYFNVILGEDNKEYYVFVSSSTSKTYVLKEGTIDFASNEFLNKSIDILFVDGDYIYYSINSEGIYRVSVRSQTTTPQQISDKTTFKTEGISFDGTYIYFYATNTDNTTGTYYLHRADVKVGERSTSPNVELLSLVLEADEPSEDEEENK